MHRALVYIIGPELFWAITCVLVRLTTRRGAAPDPSITDRLDQLWAVLPLIVVPLTFAFFFSPAAGRWWLLLRIDVAIAIGLAIATTQFCEGMTYHQPSAGPGAGTAWMLMLALGYGVAALGTVLGAVIIWWRSRVPS